MIPLGANEHSDDESTNEEINKAEDVDDEESGKWRDDDYKEGMRF